MRKVYILVLCLLAAVPLCVNAQQPAAKVTIRGKVIDSKTKEAIIGGSVVELDKDKRIVTGASTNIDGNYALRVSDPTHQLQVSYIGYKTFVTTIQGRTEINISLVPNTTEIAEVAITGRKTVNTGTGLNIDSRNNTMATATVSAKDLEELSAQSIDQALQGRLPGVDVGTTSGDPGAPMSIRIRGTSTINGSANPLIVLDGLPFDTEVPSDFNFGTADENGYAQLLNIAPTDIKDITVLKDAAATAMWGSRAANGVLVINTKRGVVGKPQISYNFKGTYSRQPKSIPLLNGNQYSTLIPEEIFNASGTPLDISANKEFSFDPMDPFWYYNYSQNTNWIAAITQDGYTQDHNVSMTGGGEKATYYASVGYTNTRGTTVGTDLNRITSKINLDYNVSSRIKFRTDITFTHLNQNQNWTNGIRGEAYTKMPNMAIFQYSENGQQTPVYFTPANNIQGSFTLSSGNGTYNPAAMAVNAVSANVGNRVIPHFNLQYSILPSQLLATFDIQFDVNNTKSNTFLPQSATGRPNTETSVNRAGDSDGDVFNVTSKLNLVYTPVLKSEKHSVQGLLSLQSNDSRYTTYNVTTSNTASSLLQDPADPSRTANSDLALTASQGQSRSIGVLLQGQYSFLDRYLFNAGVRMDGNSKFGPNHRYGYFPSASVRWRLGDEPFMKKFNKWLDDLSIRGSYGQSGNAPKDNYTYFNQYSPYNYTYLGMSGVYPSNIQLSDLRWETITGINMGFNLSLYKGRLTSDIEFYRNRTTNMFYSGLATPTSTGIASYSANVGTMDNQGWEFSLSGIPYKSKSLTVGFDFNIARNQNIIREVSDYFPRDNGTKLNTNGTYRSYLIPGNPFGSFYGYKFKGVYTDKDATIARDANGNKIIGPNGQIVYTRFGYPAVDYTFQPGDAMYEDINHDGNIDDKDVVYLGNGIPKFTGGFGPRVTWRGNWTMTAYFNYRWDYDLINTADMNTTKMSNYDNQSTAVLRRWRNPGDVTDIPRALLNQGFNWLGSDRYVESASFVRLRSLTLRYNMGKALLSKLKFKNGSFYVTGENLYTWTKYTGQDPDVSTRGDNNPFKINTDDSLTPPTKNILLGITAGF